MSKRPTQIFTKCLVLVGLVTIRHGSTPFCNQSIEAACASLRVPRSPDGIEVPHVFRVRQDEASARCHVRAEERVNRLGGGQAIVNGYPE